MFQATGMACPPAVLVVTDDGDLWDTWDDSDGTDEDNWDSHQEPSITQ
jgi:hypothetical protein